MIGPVADREDRLNVHLPVRLQRQQEPNEYQNNDVQDLGDDDEHDAKVFELVEVDDVVVAEGQLAHANDDELNCSDEVGAVVEAAGGHFEVLVVRVAVGGREAYHRDFGGWFGGACVQGLLDQKALLVLEEGEDVGGRGGEEDERGEGEEEEEEGELVADEEGQLVEGGQLAQVDVGVERHGRGGWHRWVVAIFKKTFNYQMHSQLFPCYQLFLMSI